MNHSDTRNLLFCPRDIWKITFLHSGLITKYLGIFLLHTREGYQSGYVDPDLITNEV